jgi:phosphoribosylaminoimidazolecarboxamide formyltransferase/IMP cyclohydrolase
METLNNLKLTSMKTIKTALISVYHKDGLDIIVKLLASLGVKMYSTGGTYSYIKKLRDFGYRGL